MSDGFSAESNNEGGSVEEFKSLLGKILSTAHDSEVDPRGSWTFRGRSVEPDLEVMIVELKKK